MSKRIKPKHAAQIREGLEYHRMMHTNDFFWIPGLAEDVLNKVNDAPELTQRAFDRQLEKEAQR